MKRQDPNRNDLLLVTLAYGSTRLKVIDIRGSMISVDAILKMPTNQIENLKMDEICPHIITPEYPLILKKWSKSLTKISLVKIKSTSITSSCLKALVNKQGISIIREIDLSHSHVNLVNLMNFLRTAKHLESIKLRSSEMEHNNYLTVYKNNQSELSEMKLEVLLAELDKIRLSIEWDCKWGGLVCGLVGFIFYVFVFSMLYYKTHK